MGESLPKANIDEHEVCGLCGYSFIPLTFENACVCKCGAMMGRTAITALQEQLDLRNKYIDGAKDIIRDHPDVKDLIDAATPLKNAAESLSHFQNLDAGDVRHFINCYVLPIEQAIAALKGDKTDG